MSSRLHLAGQRELKGYELRLVSAYQKLSVSNTVPLPICGAKLYRVLTGTVMLCPHCGEQFRLALNVRIQVVEDLAHELAVAGATAARLLPLRFELMLITGA